MSVKSIVSSCPPLGKEWVCLRTAQGSSCPQVAERQAWAMGQSAFLNPSNHWGNRGCSPFSPQSTVPEVGRNQQKESRFSLSEGNHAASCSGGPLRTMPGSNGAFGPSLMALWPIYWPSCLVGCYTRWN